MEFLRPDVRQFPFDATCARIVDELEARDWRSPGISVEFHDYGTGAQRLRRIEQIAGDDFAIKFGRLQRRHVGGRFNDSAAAETIAIPRKILSVFHDESGPTLRIYVGSDWVGDRNNFMHGINVNSRLNDDRRTYLLYRGSCDCGAASASYRHTHPGRRSPILAHDDDLGREYATGPGDPAALETSVVMAEIARYLDEVVLAQILSIPAPDIRAAPAPNRAPTPYPDAIGPLFCFGDADAAVRVGVGRINLDALHPADRYGLAGGRRLVPTMTRDRSGIDPPPIAFEGFLWCGIGDPAEMGVPFGPCLSGSHPSRPPVVPG